MAVDRTLIFDVRFENESGVGIAVDSNLRAEFFEEGSTTAKEIRYIGPDRTSAIFQTSDASGILYTTSIDGTQYTLGDITVKWYAQNNGTNIPPYPLTEIQQNTYEDSLSSSGIKNYVRNMLGFPAIAVELTSEHFQTIIEEALSFYGQWVPHERYRNLDLVLGQDQYPLPDLPRRGPIDVRFIRKEGVPLISDPLFGREYPRGCFIESTKVQLLSGEIKTIGELAEENASNFWVYSYDIKRNRIVPGFAKRAVKTTSNVPMVKVSLDDNTSFTCTPDHRILLKSGNYVEAQNLCEGDSIRSLYSRYSSPECNDTLNGYEIVSDGDRSDYTHRLISLESNGVYTEDGKVIHHKNFSKIDNTPNNLELMDKDDHIKLHADLTATRNKTPKMREVSRRTMKSRWETDRKSMLEIASRSIASAREAIDPQKQKEAGIRNLSNYNGSDAHVEAVKRAAKEGRHKGKENLTAYNKSEEHREFARNITALKGKTKANIHKRWHGDTPVWECKKCWPYGMPEDLLEAAKSLRSNHKVVSVEFVSNADGYDIEVEKWNNFAISLNGRDGIFVHNSQLDFDQYVLGISFWETLNRVTSQEPEWIWDEFNKTLYINIGGTNIAGASGNYFVLVRYFQTPTLDTIRNDHFRWFRRYCLCQAKKILVQIRGKFSGNIPAPGGAVTLNYKDLMAEIEIEEERLISELQNMGTVVPPMHG